MGVEAPEDWRQLQERIVAGAKAQGQNRTRCVQTSGRRAVWQEKGRRRGKTGEMTRDHGKGSGHSLRALTLGPLGEC